jgi:hypothetical protein
MKRHTFLKQSLQIGALVVLNPFSKQFLVQSAKATVAALPPVKDALLHRLVIANDNQVAQLLQVIPASQQKVSRKTGYDVAVLCASYCCAGSAYYQSPVVVPVVEKLLRLLQEGQSADGTLNFANLESPPDTAFLLEPLAAAAFLLSQQTGSVLDKVKIALQQFLWKGGEALVTGGVHTPNHRWLICGVLARLNAVYPDQRYVNRIEEWLGEAVFSDSDGHYSERSVNYAVVENNGLLTMGRLLQQPALWEPVRKNLEMTWYYMEPDGDLVTTDSRRQDQYKSKSIVPYYLFYRYLAIRDQNSRFAGIAKQIEQLKGFEEEILNKALFHFLENPLLQEVLQNGTAPPVQYEQFFASSSLLRIRRDSTTTTLFGGVDWPLIITSGRSNSPNIYAYRKGNAVLKYLRLSADFFSTGYFYSEGIRKQDRQYLLHKQLEVPYYQPLPRQFRKHDGDYRLSPSTDDRFWNKMDFAHRPVSNVKTLDTTVVFEEKDGTNELTFQVTGQPGVPVTIELCFGAGGELSGISPADEDGNCFLEKGIGQYGYKGDVIRFGPGAVAYKGIHDLEGERYSSHFGSLRTEGMHVYLTGVTPFEHTMVFS